jgi:hypothetical protein
MATRIEAQASFSNSEQLDHVGGTIATGQTAVVDDEYADELERLGLAEILDTGVEDEDDAAADAGGTASGSEASGAETDGPTEDGSAEDDSAERSFEHTEYVDEDGTLTTTLPSHDVLAESGITTFEDLAEVAGDFEVVNRIGPTRAQALSQAWDEIVAK